MRSDQKSICCGGSDLLQEQQEGKWISNKHPAVAVNI